MTVPLKKRLYASTFLVLAATTLPAFAQTVTLTALNAEMSIEGELLGFDGETYRINTVLGELTLNASMVR
ncbi:flagellar motor protein MotB, partial [Yoonia sp. R2-816]